MTSTTEDLLNFARWMASDFSNQAQALANPPLFAHIRVCMRPLPQQVFDDGIGLLIEQAYDYMLDQPYRLRVLRLLLRSDRLLLENYTIDRPERFYGASREPSRDRLQQLNRSDLEWMQCCDMNIERTGHSFKGNVEPGKGCMVFRNNRQTYLDSTFEVTDGSLTSWERGRDPETDERIWGSIAGPFQFSRTQSYGSEVVLD